MPERLGVRRHVGGDGRVRRLGDQHDQLGRRVVVEQRAGPCLVDRPADGRRQVAAADAEAVAHADPGGVEQRTSAAARRCRTAATMPTGPGRTTLAKPRPTPPTTAVPQSGPITSRPRARGPSLSRDLLLDRHVVAEHEHREAGLEGVHRLGERVRPGHRDEGEVGAAGAAGRRRRRCAARARHRRGSPEPPDPLARASSIAATALATASSSAARTATTRSLGPAVGGWRTPCRASGRG